LLRKPPVGIRLAEDELVYFDAPTNFSSTQRNNSYVSGYRDGKGNIVKDPEGYIRNGWSIYDYLLGFEDGQGDRLNIRPDPPRITGNKRSI